MEKVKVRINNSHKHIWEVVWNGQPEDFSDAKDITLIASVRDKRINLTQGIDYVIEGNLVKIDFTPRFCKNTGVYNIELNYTKPSESFLSGERRTAVDLNVIEIVGTSACADATDETSSVSEAAFGFQGLSAYEVWLKDNPDSTKEDYFNWLQKPATDIAETVNLQEQARVESENTRKNNEEQRVEAEGLRASGEVARNTAEGIRVSSENTRIENEEARELAENERATAEAVRVQAENERETAETTRISNENNRVTAEQERVNAESLRVTAESSRELAESLRVDAEILRQTNTQIAITTTEDATEKANTAAQNADDARLAIQDDLAQKADHGYESIPKTLKQVDDKVLEVDSNLAQLAGELNQNSNLETTSKNVVGAINELHSGLATKASHGYVSDPKTLRDVEDQLSTRIDRHQESLNDLLGIPDVFGYRFQVGQADDRVEAVNDVAYDYSTGYAPAGSKRAKLLDKMRPYQCDLDGSNREYLQDDVRKTAGWKDSQLANPEKLQLVRIPHFFYRSFVLDGWNYVLFSELPPEKMEVFSDATQWKEIKPCGYPRYRGVVKNIDGQSKLLSFSGEHPTVSRSLINFQADAKRTNPKATVTPYYIYEAITLLMVLELSRRNTQVFYTGITNAGTSYANAAVTGVTDTLTTPSGEVDVEYESGQFTKQFRWRFIECVYGQIWNFLTGIYYVYDEVLDMNKVYIARDPEKINTNSDYSEYIHVGNTPASNGYVKEMIPGMIECSELGGSSTTYWCDYHYTSNSATTRTARSGGSSDSGGSAGPFCLYSSSSPASAHSAFGAALVLPD